MTKWSRIFFWVFGSPWHFINKAKLICLQWITKIFAWIKLGCVVIQLLSCVWLFATPWTASCQASLSFTVSWSLFRFMSIESVMLSKHLILCCTLLHLLSIYPSIRVFFNDFALHIRWQKYWSFSFSIRSSNEYSGLISFRIDWFDLLAVQGTLKSLLQNHSLKASILSAQPSLWFSANIHVWLVEKP